MKYKINDKIRVGGISKFRGCVGIIKSFYLNKVTVEIHNVFINFNYNDIYYKTLDCPEYLLAK